MKIGITGGIGSGKSTVCTIFKVLRIPVYHADERAKIIVNRNPEIRESIIGIFGVEAYKNDSYNAEYISNIVFSNKKKLDKLNSIIHPFVEKDFLEWAKRNNDAEYLIEEAAILFESGANKNLDYVIVVNAPLAIRIQRIREIDGITEEIIYARMKNQWPADKILALADWIVENDEKHLLLPQVLSIHDQLIS
jgi:dephospho-CoA kinase